MIFHLYSSALKLKDETERKREKFSSKFALASRERSPNVLGFNFQDPRGDFPLVLFRFEVKGRDRERERERCSSKLALASRERSPNAFGFNFQDPAGDFSLVLFSFGFDEHETETESFLLTRSLEEKDFQPLELQFPKAWR